MEMVREAESVPFSGVVGSFPRGPSAGEMPREAAVTKTSETRKEQENGNFHRQVEV